MKNIKKLLAGITLAMLAIQTTALAKAISPITIQCNDTIAGFSADAEITTLKEAKISIMLEGESGKKVFLQEESDSKGNLKFEINDYHIKNAGNYALSARFLERNEDYGKRCTFTVYPSDVSKTASTVKVDRKTAHAGPLEAVIAEVKLKDSYGNPIKGHSVELLSSRAEDSIQLLSQLPYTDDNGVIAFLVSSDAPGMTTLSAIDTTENVTLNSREKIAFIEQDKMLEVGGNETQTDYTYGSYIDNASIFLSSTHDLGEVFKFMVEVDTEAVEDDETAKIKRNEVTSVTVTAVDELENIVPNYTGTIRFSSTDENSVLPEDYTFTAEDLGMHEFALGVTFKTEGPHVLSVTDINNFSLNGESDIIVTPAVLTNEVNGNGEITLLTPSSGTVNKKTSTVSGTTLPDSNVEIYVNDTLKQTVDSDANGSFSANITNLDEGQNSLYVIVINEENNITSESQTIELTVDTSKPVIESFKVSPDTIVAGEEMTVTLSSEENLSSSSLIINDRPINLTESAQGTYSATFMAPEEGGDYEIDVVLEDQVGNNASFTNQASITVQAAENIPSTVSEISAVGEDKKVTLTWAASEDDTYISKYKISYGTVPDKLYLSATTFDSSTTWYIPELENNTPYYFGIQAIDSDGNESEMSELIQAEATAPVEEPVSLEDPVILEELPEKTPETGPELWFIVIASLLIVDIFYRKKAQA